MNIWSVWIHLSALLQPDALATLCFPVASTLLNGISSFQPLQRFFFPHDGEGNPQQWEQIRMSPSKAFELCMGCSMGSSIDVTPASALTPLMGPGGDLAVRNKAI